MHKKLRVGVLMGGPSSEHSVSLKSGGNVMKSLDKNRYLPHGILVGRSGDWPETPEKVKEKTDVVFVAMHGAYGEDGTVQSILDRVGLPYTGSGALQSALAMNKFLTLRFLRERGVRVPLTLIFSRNNWLEDQEGMIKEIELYIPYPLVIKPNRDGSSVGVSILKKGQKVKLFQNLDDLFQSHKEVIVQPFIKGREFTCGVLDNGASHTAYALPPTEIVPLKSDFFDFDAKYNAESSLEITPATVSPPWINTIKRTALFVHEMMGLKGMSRTDMILGNDGKIYVLEVNTIPGLTDASLLPKAAKVAGIEFPELLHKIISASYFS